MKEIKLNDSELDELVTSITEVVDGFINENWERIKENIEEFSIPEYGFDMALDAELYDELKDMIKEILLNFEPGKWGIPD